jgi:hypothetical protein
MGQQDKPTRESGVWRPMGGEGATQRASDDDDVEGHKFQERASQRVGDDEDVEGHKFQERASQRVEGDDDDVEGHKQLS